MSSSTPFCGWKVLVFQVILPAVTFAVGWHFASELSTIFAPPAKNVAPSANKKSSGSHSTGDLAQAKADLAKANKISGKQGEHALLDFIGGLDADTVKGLLADLATKHFFYGNEQTKNQDMMNFLIDRFVELNPKAALDWAQVNDPKQRNSNMVEQVFKTWTAQNPTDALAALRALPIGEQSSTLGFSRLYSDVFGAWAQNDPTAAAASASSLPASAVRNESFTAIADAWAQQDPTGELAWANSLPPGSGKNDAVNAAIIAMSQQDPQAAADAAAALPGTQSRYVVDSVAASWAGQDPAAVFAWADNSLTGEAHDDAVATAFQVMSSSDPAAAAAYLAQNPDPSLDFSRSSEQLAINWVQQDSQAALAWAQSLPATNDGSPNSNLRQDILNSVVFTWAANDPADAAAYILNQNFTTAPNFGELASRMASNWANSDPQAALTWAQSLPAGDAQNTTVSAVLGSIAQFDPQTAWNDAQQLSGSNQDKALGAVITAWAGQQPAQAAAALASLPAGNTLDSATVDVASSWLRQDPAAASQWIDALPQGPARDGAVGAIISNVGKNDPASAYNWAVTIGDPTDRDIQVVQLATQWSAKDPAAAAAAAQTALNLSGLTPGQQTALQKIASKISP